MSVVNVIYTQIRFIHDNSDIIVYIFNESIRARGLHQKKKKIRARGMKKGIQTEI